MSKVFDPRIPYDPIWGSMAPAGRMADNQFPDLPTYTGASSNTAPPGPPPNLADILAMVKKLEAQPKPKWLLVAPDGRTWAEANPAKLAGVIVAHCDLSHIGTP